MRKHTNLTNEIYKGNKPKTDWIPTLLGAVCIVFIGWAVYVVMSIIEMV